MFDKEQMIKQVLSTLNADHSLWPTEYNQNESENYLAILTDLVTPATSAKGAVFSSDDYERAKVWAKKVMDIYIQRNPFQGAFVKPYAKEMFETLDKVWKKRLENQA